MKELERKQDGVGSVINGMGVDDKGIGAVSFNVVIGASFDYVLDPSHTLGDVSWITFEGDMDWFGLAW